MKKLMIAGLLLVLLGFGLFSVMTDNTDVKPIQGLPWKVSTNNDGSTRVLGVNIGNVTFKELMLELKLLAEPALFESADGDLKLEAFFGKQKFGVLEARLIAELEADDELLKKMLNEQVDKDSTPSNHWKYALNTENTKLANDLRVWRLVYLPVTDYEPKQMDFFGPAEEIIKVNESAEYRLYPRRGMVLLWDKEGKEIFYYVAQKDFARLKASLPMKAQIQRH